MTRILQNLIVIAAVGFLVLPNSVLPCAAEQCAMAGDVGLTDDQTAKLDDCCVKSCCGSPHSKNDDKKDDRDSNRHPPCDCPPGCPSPCGNGKPPCPPVARVDLSMRVIPFPFISVAAEEMPPFISGDDLFRPPRD